MFADCFCGCGAVFRLSLSGSYTNLYSLDMHYRGLTSREEAEQFFALRQAQSNGDFTAIGKGTSVSGTPEVSKLEPLML